MTVRGSVAYQITSDLTGLFSAPGTPLTLQNDGPADVYLSTLERHDISGAIRLNVNASVPWDSDKACFGRTLSGRATVRVTDNGGVITDPAAIATAILDQGLAASIAAAISITPLTSSSVILLRKFLYAPLVGEVTVDYDEFILDGVRYHYPLTYEVDGESGFRILKAQISARNTHASDIARFTYYLQSAASVIYALNTISVAPGDVANLIVDYAAGTEAGVIGGGANFVPKLGVSTTATDLNIDVDYLCATFGSILPPGAHGDASLIQQSTPTQWPAANSPAPAKSVVFPAAVAIGDLIAVAIAFRQGDIDHVSGCGVAAWNIVKSRDPVTGYTTAVAWCNAVAVGTTATISFTVGLFTGPGSARGYQLHGVSNVMLSATMPVKVVTANPATPTLESVTANQVYLGVTVHAAGGAPVSYTEVPSAFDATYDADSIGNDNWMHAGLKIADGVEAIDRTVHWGGGVDTISVAVLFT